MHLLLKRLYSENPKYAIGRKTFLIFRSLKKTDNQLEKTGDHEGFLIPFENIIVKRKIIPKLTYMS